MLLFHYPPRLVWKTCHPQPIRCKTTTSGHFVFWITFKKELPCFPSEFSVASCDIFLCSDWLLRLLQFWFLFWSYNIQLKSTCSRMIEIRLRWLHFLSWSKGHVPQYCQLVLFPVNYHKIDSLPMSSSTLCRTGVPDLVDPGGLLLSWELNPLSVLFLEDPELWLPMEPL